MIPENECSFKFSLLEKDKLVWGACGPQDDINLIDQFEASLPSPNQVWAMGFDWACTWI